MNYSRYYDEIKSRAIQLLTSPSGFNGYSAAEIAALVPKKLYENSTVSVAVCMARDEVRNRATAHITTDAPDWWTKRKRALREIGFGKTEYTKLKAEIRSEFRNAVIGVQVVRP